ncbi:MAG: hypothetical protein ACRDA4_04715, partial [Filifactoraceae bacterium]
INFDSGCNASVSNLPIDQMITYKNSNNTGNLYTHFDETDFEFVSEVQSGTVSIPKNSPVRKGYEFMGYRFEKIQRPTITVRYLDYESHNVIVDSKTGKEQIFTYQVKDLNQIGSTYSEDTSKWYASGISSKISANDTKMNSSYNYEYLFVDSDGYELNNNRKTIVISPNSDENIVEIYVKKQFYRAT